MNPLPAMGSTVGSRILSALVGAGRTGGRTCRRPPALPVSVDYGPAAGGGRIKPAAGISEPLRAGVAEAGQGPLPGHRRRAEPSRGTARTLLVSSRPHAATQHPRGRKEQRKQRPGTQRVHRPSKRGRFSRRVCAPLPPLLGVAPRPATPAGKAACRRSRRSQAVLGRTTATASKPGMMPPWWRTSWKSSERCPVPRPVKGLSTDGAGLSLLRAEWIRAVCGHPST